MFFQNKGQALLETCITLPIAIMILSSLVGLILISTNFYLADHWVYQSGLCLASKGVVMNCKDELHRKLTLLPLANYNIKTFFKTSSQTFVSVDFNTMGISTTTFQEQLQLPLRGNDFRR